LSGLAASYNAPSAELDAAVAASVLADAPPMAELAAGFRAGQFIASKSVDDTGSDTTPTRGQGIRLQGSLKVDVRCPGFLDTPVYDPSVNGSASLTLAVENTRIRRTFGGQADNCTLRGYIGTQSAEVHINGTIAFDLGQDIGLGQHWSGRLLAYLPGELDVGDYTFQSVSARFTSDKIEHLIVLTDGTTVVLTYTDAGISVRDKDGVWLCQTGETCARQ
jgi:hypothetical protein